MQWTAGQDRALVAAAAWLRQPATPGVPSVFRVDGAAGTGKSTLASELAGLAGGRVVFLCPTGKSATVLADKLPPGSEVSTIHRKIYEPKEKSRARLRELELEQAALPLDDPTRATLQKEIMEEYARLSRPSFGPKPACDLDQAALVIIDEAFMVGERVGEDLMLSNPPRVLVLGDTFQLPPVADKPYFTRYPRDAYLDEITRTAAGNPIIRIATMLRNGQVPPHGVYTGDGFQTSRVIPKASATIDVLAAHEMVVVGKNSTRRLANVRLRQRRWGEDILAFAPRPGDKLVCLRNDYELGIMNGMPYELATVSDVDDDSITAALQDPDGNVFGTVMLKAHFDEYRWPGCSAGVPPWVRKDKQEFDYGYAMTCHKLQGSECGNVLVFAEPIGDGTQEKFRWLYTAATRPRDYVTLAI